MIRCSLWLGMLGLMASSLAWAGSGGPAPQLAASSVAAQPSLSDIKQKLAKHQVEVNRLQQDVAKQESDSKQASERLQQQDQTITELQQQLQALRAKSASNHQ